MDKNNLTKLKDILAENSNLKKREKLLFEMAASKDEGFVKLIKSVMEIIDGVLTKEFNKERDVNIKNPVKEVIVKSILEQVMVKNFPQSFEISNLGDIKQKEFPKSFIIKSKRLVEIRKEIESLIKSNEKLIGQLIKQGEGSRDVKILNSKPEEAIPVVLATSDRKRFYNVMMQVLGAAGTDPKKLDSIVSNTNPATTPDISNVSMPSANTEYSLALPANTKKFLIKLRATNSLLKVAYTVNESGSVFMTIPFGSSLNREGLRATSKTLYFQSPSASQTAEIETWV